jgi:hypothetical protein
MSSIGFGHYNELTSLRYPLYLSGRYAYFNDNIGNKYSVKLDLAQLLKIKIGYKLHMVLTTQNYSEIKRDGLKIQATFRFSSE